MFSSQEFLQNAAMGFDGINRRLILVAGTGDASSQVHILSLNDIKSCSLRIAYRPVKASGSEQEMLDCHLEKLSLCFEHKGGGEPAEIIFYDCKTGNVHEIKTLLRKAKHWQIILSKMLANATKCAL
jgi:hypothetical protein